MAVHHIFPIVFSVTDLVLTKMYFLKKDTLYVFIAGIAYMFWDMIGSWATFKGNGFGRGVYNIPGINWDNFWLSFAMWVFQAFVMAGFHYTLCVITQRIYLRER